MAHREPQQTGGGIRQRIPLPMLLGLLALVVAAVVGGDVRPAAALHYVDEPGGFGCYSCHTLATDEGETGTSYINKASRTLSAMKAAYNPTTPTAPPEFGCTYCHNNTGNVRMRGVLAHFSGKTSMHPVGKSFVTNANTETEYLSTWGSANQNQLDCVDCHDVAAGGAYPEHGTPPVANPFMLRNVATAGEYDNLCRTCHGNSAPFIKGANDVDHNFQLTTASVHTDGDTGGGGSGALAESDGTPLQPAITGGNDQCRKCHDTHYSNNYKLFNDGHEGAESNLDVGTDCTSVCHFNGDQNNNFETHGHGMNTSSKGNALNFNCTNCHTVNARHDSPFSDSRSVKMFAATPDPLFSSLTPTKSLTSVCYTCHGTLVPHAGTVGCLDCHDEHAEGSGATSNIFMIPQQLPNRTTGATEAVVFEHASGTDYDFYINDIAAPHIVGGGVCDNGVCHLGQATVGGTPFSPLSVLLTGGNHSGGDKAPLFNCQACHTHANPAGSWKGGGCDTCHGMPPSDFPGRAPGYFEHFEEVTPHARHSRSIAAGGYDYDCTACHLQKANNDNTHNADSDGDGNPPASYDSVWFDQALNPSTAGFPYAPTDPPPHATPDYDPVTNTCSSLYCHSNGSSLAAVGTAVWMTGAATPNWATNNLPCNACHNNGAGQPYPANYAASPANGTNHALHVGKGVGCQNCHSTTTANGTSILVGNNQHVDREKDVVAGYTYNAQAVSFVWTSATKTCSALSCHNGRQFTAAPIDWTTAAAAGWCTNCHNNGTNDGLLTSAWPAQGEHQLHAGALPANYAYLCFRCHPDNSVTHSALDKSATVDFTLNFVAGGSYSPNGINGIPGDGDDATCDATYCHGTGSLYVPDWDDAVLRLKTDSSVTATVDCNMCHGTANQGVGVTATGRPNSPAAGGRHTGTTHATLDCTICHLNDNTDHTLHAKGPAQTGPPRADAAMAATIDGAIYVRAGSASIDQGFSYTNGTCADMTTGCHPAADWGQTFSCALCHGDRTAVPPTFWPDGTNTAGHYYDTDAGSHPEHIAALRAKEGFTLSQADQAAMCAYCHPNPGSATHRTDTVGSLPDRVDVIRDGFNETSTFSRIDSVANLTATADGHTAATYSPATLRCSNSDCHYEKPTPAYAGLGWDDGDAQTPNCETCHFTRGTVGLDTYPTRAYVVGTAPVFADGDLPDSHLAHVAGIASPNVNASKSYDCSFCHTVLPNTAHLNGSIDLSALGNPTITKGPGVEAITATTTAVKYGVAADAVCTNMYCHGADFGGAADGTGGTRGTDITPVWNLQATGTCGTCHDIDTEAGNTWGQQLTQGAHGTHMAGKSGIAWGPGLNSHANRCQVCHGWKDDGTVGTPVGCTTNCHAMNAGTPLPGGAFDAGYVWEPSANHVNGSVDTDFQVDFEDQDRGWSDAIADVYNSPNSSGTPAPLATTDICDVCHSTANVGGQVGVTVAKANWAAATRITNCLLCHNAASPAESRAVSGGVVAPDKDTFYAANGHGNAGPFNATLHNQNGPGYACSVCHAENSAHISGALGQDRLDAANSDALDYTTPKSEFCLDCHGPSSPGALGVNAVAEASVHSGGVTGRYAPAAIAGNAYGNSASLAANPGYQCDACHDPHGTGKLAMIRTSIDGNVGGISNPVTITNFTSAETDLFNLDPAAGTVGGQAGVCDACHRASAPLAPHPDTAHADNHNQGGTGDSCMVCHDHRNSFVGSCTGCHGGDYAAAGNLNYWPGGAGAAYPTRTGEHNVHITRLAAQLGYTLASLTDTQQKTMCAYCHNDSAGVGGGGHNDGGAPAEVGDFNRIWDAAADSAPVAVYTPGNGTNGVCSNVDCHNNKPALTTPTTYDWYDGAASACAMCHKDIPTEPTHLAHAVANSTYGIVIGCAGCHEATTWNVSAPATGHINGTWTMKAGLTYDGSWATSAVGSCATNICHNDGKYGAPFMAYVWGTPLSTCFSCHAYAPNLLTESHDEHMAAAMTTRAGGATGVISCNDCHTGNDVPTHIDGSVSFGGTTSFLYDGDTAVTGTTLGTCGINACHNDGKNGTVRSLTYTWGTPIGGMNSCTECHGDDATSLTTQAHQPHLNAAALFGRPISCPDCHAAATAATHANGSVSFGGTVIALDATYTGDKVVSGTTYGTCGINACHNDGTGLAQALNPAWDTIQTDCTTCHLNTIADTPMASNAHNEHMNATPAYAGAACVDCHTPQTAATHINGSTNFETVPVTATYSKTAAFPNDATASGTCLTASCHNRGAVPSAAWDIAAGTGAGFDLACNACHYYELAPTSVNNAAHFDPLSTSHNDHFDRSKLCVECHGALPTTTAHITGRTSLADGAVAVDDEADVTRTGLTFSDGVNDGAGPNNTCSGGIGLGCHATGTPDWEVAFASTACLNCHTNKTTLAVNPTSGLHGAVPRLSTNTHDEDWDADGPDGAVTADCMTCHTATPSTGHTNGTLEGSPTVVFAADVGFLDAATPTCGPNNTLSSCHGPTGATNGDAGTWRRLWSPTVANSDGTECANCHGGMDQTWTFGGGAHNANDGSVEHEYDWDGDSGAEVSGNHLNLLGNGSKCNTCHVYAAPPYVTMGWAPQATSTYHGNGSIEMNATQGYAEATWNCADSCHFSAQGNAGHAMENSVWPVNALAGPALGCTSCHGGDFAGASNLNYWPGGAGALYPDRVGEHNVHMARLATKLGYTLTALTDPQQKSMCRYCHTYATDVGEVGHGLGGAPAEVGSFNRIWDSSNDPDAIYTPGNGTDGVCSNVDCHNRKPTAATPTAYDWYDGAASACVMCHKDIPAEPTHVAHTGATGTFGIVIDCADCHEATTWNVSAPTTGHLDGVWTMRAGLNYDGSWFTGGMGTCGVNLCHNNGKFGFPLNLGYTWGNAIPGCTACHNVGALATESHDEHLNTFTAAGINIPGSGISCSDCHTEVTAATHINGSVNFGGYEPFVYDGDVAVTGTTFGSCGINMCHNNGKNGSARTAYTWGIGIGALGSCTECHGDDAASLTTQAHAQHLNAATLFGRSISCPDCHGGVTPAAKTHANGSVTIGGTVAPAYTGDVVVTNTAAPYGTCGTNACHNDGTGAAPALNPAWDTIQADCTICHGNPPAAGNSGARHVAHVNNASYVSGCGSCHQMAAQATHINGSVTMSGTVAYTSPTCTNLCHWVNASTGDWMDTDALACVDCHDGAHLFPAPTSGLHTATTAMAHDVLFMAYQGESPETASCISCHTESGPSTTHLTGGFLPESSVATTYSFVSANVSSYNQGTGCQATCHTDYKLADPGGLWRRKWVGVTDDVPGTANNPGDPVCANCHGDFTNGWNLNEANASTTGHTDPYAGNIGDGMANHNVCESCHGWGNANYNEAWGGPAPGHGDGFITMNGPDNPPGPVAGAQYDDDGSSNSGTGGGCAAACHSVAFVLNTNSGWTANYGDFGAGNCENCHGNPPNAGNNGGAGDDAPNVMGDSLNATGTGGATPKPFDDGTYGFNVNGHGADGSADHNPVGLNPNRACTDCHSLQSHHFDGVLDGVSGRGNATRYVNNYHLRTDSPSFIVGATGNDWDAQIAFDNACWMRCHEPINNFTDMRHAKDLIFDAVRNLNIIPNAVRFGDKRTVANGESIAYPVDSDITTRALLAADDFVTCATCHNVHGTDVVEPQKTTNRMVRDNFFESSTLCVVCHQ